MIRHSLVVALCGIGLLVPAQAKERQDLREQVKDGVQRTDKDLETLVHPDKLNTGQRERFESAMKDLQELGDAVTSTRWEGERNVLERAVGNIEFVMKNAPMEDGDRQTLGIDVFTLHVILDKWKTAP